MAANTAPITPLTPNLAGFVKLATANTATDGTGTAPVIHTAGVNGSSVEKVRVMHLGTNVATVLRIFINNGSTPATATNNALFAEITIPANTVSQVAQSAQNLEILLNPGSSLKLPAGYKLLATIGTTIAAGIMVLAMAGDY